MKRYVLAALAVTLVVGVAVTRTFARATGPMAELSRFAPSRTFAARLSIATPFQPCEPDTAARDAIVPRESCGAAEDARINPHDLEAGGESSAPDSLQAAALAAVIWWNETEDQALNDAILRLEKAARLTLESVPILVDLSAAHLVRAERMQAPRDLYQALEYALQAIELEPLSLPALYNAALAKQAVGLDEEAAEAWDAYLAVDRRSAWAGEARRRKSGLITGGAQTPMPGADASASEVAAFARTHPQEARTHGWDVVLGDWGKAVEAGDSASAALHLAFAEKLGLALEQRPGGDASLADAVRAIRAAGGNRGATMTLARAHRAYAVAQALASTQQFQAALDASTRVTPTRNLSPVLDQWTELLRARAVGSRGHRAEAESALIRLSANVDGSRHPALAGAMRRMRATLLAMRGDFQAGRQQSRLAAEYLRRAGETEQSGSLLSTDGETAYQAGDTVEAFRLLHQAQQALRPHRRSIRLHNQLHGLARAVALSGMPRAALAILDEDVRVARRNGGPTPVVDALQMRARIRTILGDSARAAADLDSAYSRVRKLRDPATQEWAVNALRMARPSQISVAEINSAVAAFEQNVVWLAPALLARADAHLAASDLAAAIRDLETVLGGVRPFSGRRTAEAVVRAAALEQARSRFNRLVMLYLRAGDTTAALQTLERGRVSFAAVSAGDSASAAGPLRAPAGQVGLEYALIGDTLLAWTVRADTVHLVRQTIDRDQFLLTVEQVGAAMESPEREAAARPGLRRLYGWLIAPVRGRLGPPGTMLVILADGEVAGVPFAALIDSRNRHLVQDHPLRYAPTLADAARPWSAGDAQGRALLVADPDFDRVRYPSLDGLDGARAEVDALEPFFPGAMRLDGDSATRAAFLTEAQRASLIHYAGHAVFDDARPERSYLVLAGADTTGRLTAEEVSQMRLGNARLVVLSACRTLRARGGRSGGFAGLSGALLSAGAGGVAGSLWQVNDGRAQPLMVAFYRAYGELRDPALALRQAQLDMLESTHPEESSLATWAGFRYAGN
ncbi:MAG TPA: CHAT domain-containing protein [Longimicrobium sp.]|nr:CHAT domain-containing protein [Longimicrobium sp.]